MHTQTNRPMRNLFSILAFSALFLASCGGGSNETAQKAGPSACDCAKLTMKAEGADASFKDACDKLIADATFNEEYKKCLGAEMTGGDANKVNLVDSDEMKFELPGDGTYELDITNSNIEWKATKITGAAHEGVVPVQGGTITFTDGKVTAANIIMDMENLMVTDLEGEDKENLEGHLKSPDFFDVVNHKTASFTFTEGETVDNKLSAKGMLNIKGMDKDSKASLMYSSNSGDGAVISGSMIFDRTDFDIKYGSGKFFDDLGDRTIKDNVMLKMTLKANKVGA